MGYVILLLLIALFMFFWYLLFNREIITPTIISYASYFICVLFAFLGLNRWNNEIRLHTSIFWIVLLGLLFFGIGELVARIFTKPKKRNKEVKVITVDKWKNIFSICFLLLTIVLCYLEIKKVCNSYGYYSSNLGDLLSFYRYKSNLFSDELLNVGFITTIVNQMKKIAYILSIFYIYIFTNNLVKKVKMKQQIPYCIVIVLALFLGFLSSGRFEIFKYLMAMFFSYFIIMYEKLGQKAKKKILKTILIAMLIIIPTFYYVLPLLGRSTEANMFDYITFYFGSSIPSFNRYLSVSHAPSAHFGEESLYGIQMLLYKLKIIDYTSIISREWTFFYNNQFNIALGSNIYTSFRRFYSDFGYVGIIIFQFLFGFVFTKIYQKAKERTDVRKTVFYLAFSYMLVDQIRDDLFMTRFFHVNTIIYMILIYLINWFIFELKIKRR